MAKIVIGIMGPGEGATRDDCQLARELGQLIALEGWVLLTGGRSHGVMHAAAEGAKAIGGLTVGILPSAKAADVSSAIDIPILTGLGEARNVVNVLTCNVVVVCGMSAGTASEAALALKVGRPLIFVAAKIATLDFFASLDRQIYQARDAGDAISVVKSLLREA